MNLFFIDSYFLDYSFENSFNIKDTAVGNISFLNSNKNQNTIMALNLYFQFKDMSN